MDAMATTPPRSMSRSGSPETPPPQSPLSPPASPSTPPPLSPVPLNIFTPVKRTNDNPLFLPSPGAYSLADSSTYSPSPAKRRRIDENGNDIDPNQAGPSVTIQHGTDEGGLTGSAIDPLTLGNGRGAEIGTDLGTRPEGAEEEEGVKKRVYPKLDHDRLIGKSGFPVLIKDMKRFRPRGKGHEAEDLSNLLETYRLWAHKMFPKLTFGDTVTKVESLCHARVMSSVLSRYRDEAKMERDQRDGVDLTSTEDREMHSLANVDETSLHVDSHSQAQANGVDDNPFLSPRSRRRLALAQTSTPTSVHNASTAQAEEDEEDLDAMIALAEEEARGLSNEGPAVHENGNGIVSGKGKEKENIPDEEEDYGAFEMPPEDDDEEGWAAMQGM